MNAPSYLTGFTQAKAYRLLREHVYEVLSEYDLTPTSWSMLGIITEAKDGVRQVEIARTLHVKAPLVTAMAQQLEGRGLIKSAQNQFDGRAKLLALTSEGKRFVRTVEQAMNRKLSQLLSGLTEADLSTYHKVLSTIIVNDNAIKNH